jgi:type II secretory pathway pseudopilin PulG
MTSTVVLLGFSVVLAVAAIAVSLFAVWRSKAIAELSDERTRARFDELQAAAAALQKAWHDQAAELADLQRQPQGGAVPASLRAGLNLCKRSQALRMYRKGDPPDRIAAALEVPLQEVDLLVKVHRIVLSHG